MKKLLLPYFLVVIALVGINNSLNAQIVDKKTIIDSLTTIDPNIVTYFPRWKVCEPDLMAQIYQAFLYKGYAADQLSKVDITVLGAPKESSYDPFDILLITCGNVSMNTVEIESTFNDLLVGFISGYYIYNGPLRGTEHRDDASYRDYCFTTIPGEEPVSPSQAAIISSYLERPTNVDHAFSLSLFEQSLKIGESGFWVRSISGTDQVGYHFWSSGESKIILQRPLYVNRDDKTQKGIPYLINAYLGGGYRMRSGLDNTESILSWIPKRILNAGPGGKIIFGTDVHAWFRPEAGISLNMELPLSKLTTENVELGSYGLYNIDESRNVDFDPNNPILTDPNLIRSASRIAPILRATGQVSAFYHWWLDKMNPENYFRFDLGLSYCEVQEAYYYELKRGTDAPSRNITNVGVDGLFTYKPNEFMDWLFFKVEYRSQAVYPFGASIQVSNQILLSRAYIPLFGNWLYLEAKYSTPIRDVRPYEIQNFFMISPVLRLTI
jgi:hypothetical protein